jgi:hypothetical protein
MRSQIIRLDSLGLNSFPNSLIDRDSIGKDRRKNR